MKSRNSIVIIFSVIIIANIINPCMASTPSVPSADLVPQADWTYDALGSLAADKLIEGFSSRTFHGDRLYNRTGIARVIDSLLRSISYKDLTGKQISIINNLVREYQPELQSIDPSIIENWNNDLSAQNIHGLQYFGYGELNSTSNSFLNTNNDDITYKVTTFYNPSPSSLTVASITNNNSKKSINFNETNISNLALIKKYGKNWRWSIGQDYASWGPAYSGSLILSDNSPAFLQFKGSVDINAGKKIGALKFTQLASTFNDDGKRLYLLGRRLEKNIDNNWYIGISESVKMNETPNPLMMVMPFLLYQKLDKSVDDHLSYMGSIDIMHEKDNGDQFYGQFLIDEITTTALFVKNGNKSPKQTGYVIGYNKQNVFSKDRLSTLRAEYVRIDRLTYRATRSAYPELSYTHDGEFIGHPFGQNGKGLYLRSEQNITDKLNAITEYVNLKPTGIGEPYIGSKSMISFLFSYDIAPDKSVSFRIAPYRITPHNEDTDSGTLYEMRTSFSF